MAGSNFEEIDNWFNNNKKEEVILDSEADTVDLRQPEYDEVDNWFNANTNLPPKKKSGDRFEPTSNGDSNLTQADLMSPQRLNTIREYMIAKNGVDYEDYDGEKVVDDFVENMRWFNTNTLSTAGEVVFINRANDREKQVANEAYKLYDQLGSFWSNDGLYGRAEGIFDYVKAAASDPSNYIGLLTGGAAKAGTLTIAQGGKMAVRKAAADAAKRATKRGSTKKGAQKAGEDAAASTAKMLEKMELKGPQARKIKKDAFNNAKKTYVAQQEQAAAKLVTAEASKKANRNALIATALTDSAIAYVQDDKIQDIFLEANYQEKYNRMQSLMVTAAGGLLAPAVQLGFRQFKGASGFGKGIDKLDLLERTGPMNDFLPMATKKNQKKAVKVIRKAYTTWAKKVKSGDAISNGEILPDAVFVDIMLGPQSIPGNNASRFGGIADIAVESGIKLKEGNLKNKTVSDIMTNIIRYMPEEDFVEIRDLLQESMGGIHAGTLALSPIKFGDVVASTISGYATGLGTMGLIAQRLNKTVIGGNRILANAVTDAEKKQVEEAIAQPLGYAQNVWKRLLVSSPATTALNLAGFGTFGLGQSAADMMNAGMVGAWGVLSGNKDLLRQAKVYARINGQKMRNFADPLTTYEAYMKLLDNLPKAKKVLFETVGTGVDRSGGRFGIDLPLVEKVVGAANDLTGVRIQDSLTKSQMFMAEIDKYIDIKHGRTLDDVMAKGDLDLIDEEVVGLALDTTMKSVFAKNYTGLEQAKLPRALAKMVETASSAPGIGFILPFGRFMNNVVASSYQWSPLAYTGIASDIMRKSTTKVQNREANARALVGTSALVYAAYFTESQEEQKLDTFQLRSGSSIVDVQNVFPLSYLLAAGKVANHYIMGKPITAQMTKDLGEQLAIGQVSRDIQFGTDVSNVLDYLFPIGGPDTGGERVNIARDLYNAFTEPGKEAVESDGKVNKLYEFGSDVSEAIGKPFGNVVAGAFRPLDPINKMVGFLTGTDTAKDVRQARGFGKFTQASTKYFDNIFEAMMGETKNITGESLRVASREGEIYDPNPLARILGLKLLPARTRTEKTYSLVGKRAYTADSRTNVPAYDRILNEFMGPSLERRLGKLYNSPNFKKADINTKRDQVNNTIKDVRAIMRKAIKEGSTGEDWLQSLRYDVLRKGTTQQRATALKSMREEGIDANVKDFNYSEIQMLEARIKVLQMLGKVEKE